MELSYEGLHVLENNLWHVTCIKIWVWKDVLIWGIDKDTQT